MKVALRDGGGDGGGGIGDGGEGRDGDGCRLHSNSNGHGIESLLPCSSSPVPHPLKEKRAILPREGRSHITPTTAESEPAVSMQTPNLPRMESPRASGQQQESGKVTRRLCLLFEKECLGGKPH